MCHQTCGRALQFKFIIEKTVDSYVHSAIEICFRYARDGYNEGWKLYLHRTKTILDIYNAIIFVAVMLLKEINYRSIIN
jgi:hypothetical protein